MAKSQSQVLMGILERLKAAESRLNDMERLDRVSVISDHGGLSGLADYDHVNYTRQDAWIDHTAVTWTYASATSFTVSGDVTAVFKVGTKVRYKQGGAYEYGYVKSSSESGGTTTVNLIENDDYSLASATITDNYYSYGNPLDHPFWLNWTPTYTGFSSDPSGVTIFGISGGLCTVCIHHTSDGTSNSTSFEMSAPVTLNSLSNLAIAAPISFRDGGSNSSAWGMAWVVDGTPNTIKFYTDASGATATWTNSGGKRILRFSFSYPI